MSVQIDGSTGNIIAIKADYSGDVSIGGTLTYEDVTNIDAVGLITARSGVKFGASGTTVVGNSSGIGVGTDNPSYLVDAHTSSGNAQLRLKSGGDLAQIFLESTDTSGNSQINFADADSSNIGMLQYFHSDNHMEFTVNGSEAARINSSGNIEVNGGAVHIDANGELAVFETDTNLAFTNSSKLSFDFSSNIARIRTTFNGSGSARPLAFYTGSTERIRMDSSGRLLIAATSSTANSNADDLQIGARTDSGERGITVASSAAGSIRFADDGNDTAGYIFYSHSDNSLRFGSNGAERMRLDSGGDMGLGTTSPSARLEAVSNTTPQFKVGMANDADRASLMHNGSDLYLDTTAGGLIFRGASNTERMRIDSSGRLLLNHTSSINNAGVASQQQITGDSAATASLSIRRDANSSSGPLLIFGKSRSGALGNNVSVASGDNIGSIVFAAADGTDVSSQCAEIKAQIDATPGSNDTPGRLVFMTASDGSNAPTERLRIDSSGRLLLGTATEGNGNADDFTIATSGDSGMTIRSGTSSNGRIYFSDGTSGADEYRGAIDYDHADNSLNLFTDASERVKITYKGTINQTTNASDSDRYNNSNQNIFHTDITNNVNMLLENSSASPYGILIDFSDASPDNNTNYFLEGHDSSTIRFKIWSDGDLDNHDNSYGGTSDQKLKQDIVDAGSQWDDLKDLRVRKFKFKSDVAAYGDEAKTLIGLVAQEAETVCPGLVKDNPDQDDDGNDLGTVTKTVRYSVLYMKAIKALQEAQTRIETLETQNTAQQTQIDDLLARVNALEG